MGCTPLSVSAPPGPPLLYPERQCPPPRGAATRSELTAGEAPGQDVWGITASKTPATWGLLPGGDGGGSGGRQTEWWGQRGETERMPPGGGPRGLREGRAVPDRLSSGMCVSARRGGMIQTAEQYQFLHHTLALFAAQLPEEPSP